jgi:hypothetical protein
MAKSKNWSAVTRDNLVGTDLHLTVFGEINIGNDNRPRKLRKKIPQGIVGNQLILEAEPVTDVSPEVFKHVFYNEKLESMTQYSSVLILVAGTEEKLIEITKIEHILSFN